ncbi:G protein-regulated inducer of neurite outgrowth 1 [Astyanax mexicanus]|uniref:G protein-regulated inducer of neurite outgrowth 1 n=1 Tax=Astyanax mexicanus TaxID=7994 RepID=UPI0020CAF027|nr:G protein-regulated inducer of neurite outgrowth 1 [Astyanax mexicanus]
MEPRPSYQHSPRYNKPKPANQHKEATTSLGVRGENGRNGPLASEEKRTCTDALIQPKMPATADTPSTSAPVTNSFVTSPLTKSKSLLLQASTAKKTTTEKCTTVTSSVGAIATTASKTVPAKHAVGMEGLTLPLQTTATAATTERRLKSPSSSRTGELKADAKNSPKNLHKTTSSSQISMSTKSPKNLQKTASAVVITCTDSPKSMQRASLSQIPRATSSPKLKSTSAASLTVEKTDACRKGGSREAMHSLSPKLRTSQTEDRASTLANRQQAESVLHKGTEHTKEESPQGCIEEEAEKGGREKNKETKEGEDILEDMQVARIPKGRALALQVASKCPISPQDRKQLSPGATAPSAAQLKEMVGKADTNVMTQERECVTEKRKREEREKEEREKERLRERMKEKRGEERRREEQEKEDKRKEHEKAEKEKKEAERKVITREEVERERRNKSLKSFKNAATMTLEDPAPVQTAALKMEPVYVDAGIQAVVEVSCKSTNTSPNLTLRPWIQVDPDLSNNGKSPETACSIGLQNGLSPESSSNSDWPSGLSSTTVATEGAKPKFLGPPPYKSPNSHKPSLQHVCQIEIELRSHSSLSNSLALPQVTVSDISLPDHSKGVFPMESRDKDYKASSTGPGLEGDPREKTEEADKADKGPPPKVVWDEQGMTWEVYGAAVDMESLGFAIQNHLQKKIREHEQRIGNLRKSISLSEHSQPYGKAANKRKKNNVFRSMFRGSTCCSKTQPKTEAEH